MQPPDRQHVKDLFLSLVDMPLDDRHAELVRRCDDAAIRSEVEALLNAADRARTTDDGLLQVEGGLFVPVLSDQDTVSGPPDLTGRQIGVYRLDRFLGRGGMGTVYLASRTDGEFEQNVAIKLLSLDGMNPDTLRRFRAEREILASLQHPNIARLFDGGVSDDGTPYFVMEYVEGEPLDVHADRHKLEIADRLRLFLQVCEAVHHAHGRQIVHRDLKPANILVTDGHVRLLDFGIAKLTRDAAGGAHTVTATGMSPMTPAYASPEQLRGETISDATDVYALGVVLHELLTGVSPYTGLAESGVGIVHAVCVEPVPAPSTRLRQLEGSTKVAIDDITAARGVNLTSLSRRIRGDLDTIVLMALRKEPERRYASVEALAADIRRHLDGYPILARKESIAYRASRFVRRHRLAAGSGVVASLLLIVLAIVVITFAKSTNEQQKQLAEQEGLAAELLEQMTDLYESADPANRPGANEATRQVLDAAVDRLIESPHSDPDVQASLLFAAGRVYRRMGQSDDALPLIAEALELRREIYDPPHVMLAQALYEHGAILSRSGDTDAGIAQLNAALEMELSLHDARHPRVAFVRFELGTAYHDAGNHSASNKEYSEAVRIYDDHNVEPTEEYANALMSIGNWLAVTGSLEDALARIEESARIYTMLLGEDHPLVARTYSALGMIYYRLDRVGEGIDILRRGIEIEERAYGERGHPHLAVLHQNLGMLLVSEQDWTGIDHLEEAIVIHEMRTMTSPSIMAFSHTRLGAAQQHAGRLDEARVNYEKALQIYIDGNVDIRFQADPLVRLAHLLEEAGDRTEALARFEELLEIQEATLPAGHDRIISTRAKIEGLKSP